MEGKSMWLFEKKMDFYRKKDRKTWEQLKEALKKEGIRHISTGHYFGDSVAPNGIGGFLDPRNFGPEGQIDRDIYYILVPESEFEAAKNAARRHGLAAEVIDYRNR